MAMVAVTRKGKIKMARLVESSDRSTKVLTNRKRATAMIPERTGDSTHEATMADTPCGAIGRSIRSITPGQMTRRSVGAVDFGSTERIFQPIRSPDAQVDNVCTIQGTTPRHDEGKPKFWIKSPR